MILDWRKFILRNDIKNLPLEEQRRRFLKEQLYNDNLLSEQKQKQYEFYMSQMQPKGGASGFLGQGVDGPIAGATVTSNVGTTTTNAVGVFKFPKKPSGPITLTGGTDAITGLPFEGELIGYSEYKTISPITTFAHYLKEASTEDPKTPTLTIDEAVTKTFVSSSDYFGIDLPIENKDVILQKDYVGESIANNNKVGISAQAITTQIESITETVGVALEGSVIAIKSRDKGDAIPQFSVRNRKRTVYAALGRQVIEQGQITPDTITRDVVFYNPLNKRVEKGGIEFENNTALGTQLSATINELTELSKQEQYTNNYLTTRIQAVNRAQKTTIKEETRAAVENRGSFSNINTVSTSREVEDALKQIEKDKANETTPVLDGTPVTIERPQFWQLRKNKSGKEDYVQLEFTADKAYYYFGTAKDLPILMRATPGKEPGVVDYSVAEFPYAVGSEITGISLDSPLQIRTETTDEETGITTNTVNTFRPFVSSKGEESPNIGLRLSSVSVTQEKPKPVTHIADSGTYTPSFVTNEGGVSGKMTAEIIETPGGNGLSITDSLSLNYQLLPAKTQGEFRLDQIGKDKVTTQLATGIKFDSNNVATFSYTIKGLKGDAIVTWTISYAASGGGGGVAVDHIVSPYVTGVKYTFTITDSKGANTTADMTITSDLKAGNKLTLTQANIPNNLNVLNNIQLQADQLKIGNFSLTAGNENDAFKIGETSNSFNESNIWEKSVVMGNPGVQYTITISYITLRK